MKRFFLFSATLLIGSAAFAQSKCVTAPVSITGNQVTLTSSGNKSVTNDEAYIYYSRKHHKKHEGMYTTSAINDKNPSRPMLLNSGTRVSALPESYNVSISTPQSNMAVCPDSVANLAVSINLEKESSYTGNYPNSSSDSKTYKKVTKRHYKMAARKMCKIKRNEAKIARKTGTTVEARSDKS